MRGSTRALTLVAPWVVACLVGASAMLLEPYEASHPLPGAPTHVGRASSIETGSLTPWPGVNTGAATWTELHPLVHPSARGAAGLAYDSRDGYMLLYGGGADNGTPTGPCFNDTWTYSSGSWSNLSIPGMPRTCAPAMAFDAADGYIVALLASNRSTLGETWTFSDGIWTRLFTSPQPTAIEASEVYDPVEHAILLYGYVTLANNSPAGDTWEFKSGSWYNLGVDYGPWVMDAYGKLTYDAADGVPLLLADNHPAGHGTGLPQAVWAYEAAGGWNETGPLPSQLQTSVYSGTPMVWAFDTKGGYVVLYAGLWDASCSCYDNQTWVFVRGLWSEQSVVGPLGRAVPTMAFDPGDGYLLFFGGNRGGANLNDTWIYTPPPVAIDLHVAAAPTVVCSAQSLDCGVGTDEARVTFTATVVGPNSSATTGKDEGNGTVVYGPLYWAALPQLTFVGWGSVVPAPDMFASVTCLRGDGGPTACVSVPEIVAQAGHEFLTWNWSEPSRGSVDALRFGDYWSISFNVEVLGPPYGVVPVDSCTTALCISSGSGALDGHLSDVTFSPYANSTRVSDSFPLSRVTVLAPLPQSAPTSGAPSPPPPPGIGAPLPIVLPTPPTVLPLPSPVAAPVAMNSLVGANFSISAIAAGLLSAGFTRSVVSQRAQKVKVASGLATKSRGLPETAKGEQ